MTDGQQIEGLIRTWAVAVHAGELPTVLADHAPDIVMFDVPPPKQGTVTHEHHSFTDTT
jgi:ketosteroid isomerase-like protein